MEEAGKGGCVFENLCLLDKGKSSTYHPALQDERGALMCFFLTCSPTPRIYFIPSTYLPGHLLIPGSLAGLSVMAFLRLWCSLSHFCFLVWPIQ